MKNKDKRKGDGGGLRVIDGETGQTTEPKAQPQQIRLSDADRTLLQRADSTVATAQRELGAAQMQLMVAEAIRNDAAQKVQAAQNAFMTLVRELATANGVEVDDPTKGRWDLNTAEGVFSRVG